MTVALGLTLVAPAVARAAGGDPIGQVTEYSAGLNPGSRPTAIAPGPDGSLWFTDAGSTPAIGRITTGGQITEYSTGLAAGSRPNAITAGPDGNMWFTDLAEIGRITPGGQITEYSSGLNPGASPASIAVSGNGDIWFTDVGTTPALGRASTDGQITEFSAGLAPGSILGGVARDTGAMWFADWGDRTLGLVEPNGTIGESPSGLNPGSKPGAMASGFGGGNQGVWFTDTGSPAAIGSDGEAGTSNGSPVQGSATEYSSGLNSGSAPSGIAPGPDGEMWFTDGGTTPAIGRIDSFGAITELASGLNAGSHPTGLAPGADGDMWFTDDGSTPAIGRIGTGADPALQAAPSVTGAAQAGSTLTCADGQWAKWAGRTPSVVPGGYRWLLDGNPIPGQSSDSYTPTATDVGHQVSCQITVSYGFPLLVGATAASAAVTVQPAPAGPAPLHAAFSVAPDGELCPGQIVTFDAGASTPGDSPISHYIWHFATADFKFAYYSRWSREGYVDVLDSTAEDTVETTDPMLRRTYGYVVLYPGGQGQFSTPEPVAAGILGTTVTLIVQNAGGQSDSTTRTLSFFDDFDLWNQLPKPHPDPCPHVTVTAPPAFERTKPALVNNATIGLSFGCAEAATCGGLLTLRTVATPTGAIARVAARRRRPPGVVVGRSRVAVPRGEHKRVVVKLNARGRALARRGRLRRVRVSVTTVRSGGGKPKTISRVIAVRRVKHRS